jgi:hypothetical protein
MLGTVSTRFFACCTALDACLISFGLMALGASGCATSPPTVVPAPDGSTDATMTAGQLDGSTPGTIDGFAQTDSAQTYALNVTAVDTTFTTEDHFIASVEMQISGEPFAQAMGRNLGGYSRNYACQASVCSPSMYFDSTLDGGVDGAIRTATGMGYDGGGGIVDLAGFSSAVESYEYSKQPMNNIAFESGAGTSLLFGTVLNPTGLTGEGALTNAQNWFSRIAGESNATFRIVRPISPSNPLGWPGLWPTLQPFSSWDPSIKPTNEAGCSLSSDDNPGAAGALICDDYECDYTTLHLPDRAKQVSMTIGPGSSGWTGWKEALWTLNYLQVMHDDHENPITNVAPSQLKEVGQPGNLVGGGLYPGVYLGSSNVEGFQAGNFLQILDNQAAQWLLELTTSDGTKLSGFASISDALAYSPTSSLRWFPASIRVTETSDASGFPRPESYTIASAGSYLLDLAGLLGAYSSIYSLTDLSNAVVGGSQPAMAYFDGDPFPVQNQTPNGSPTLHDRALAVMRVLVVNIDRFHVDQTTGLFADTTTVTGGSISRGTTLSADVAAYTLLALRTARRALDSELALYSNTTPDTEGIPCSLDAFPPIDGVTFSSRLDQLIDGLSGVIYDHLTDSDGHAFAGWDLTRSVVTDGGTSLDAYSAGIRGLLVAYLATGNIKFRDRAASVFVQLEDLFYDPSPRAYRAVAGDRSLQVTFTPRRFGLLQGALRDTYELIALLPGNEAMATLIEDRVARLNKLVLNGWDDRDGDQLIEWPSECAHLGTGPDGKPLGLGGLQMGERVLSGESGSLLASPFFGDAGARVITTDREHDCVPEISAAHLPSALANSVTFTLTPWSMADEGKIFQDGGGGNP